MAQDGTSTEPEHTDVTAMRRFEPKLHPGDCARVHQLLARVGDRWSTRVVMLLGDGSMRFSDLKRATGGASQRMLTLTLRGLERDGLVSRTAHPSIPPRVDYALTPLGRSLAVPVKALGAWALDNADAVDAARADFDNRPR